MNIITVLLVGSGSAVGALARYSLGRLISRMSNSEFPWGTWIINMLGTLLLGLILQELSVIHHELDWSLLLGTGFCGGFTTFSTMSVEVVQLFKTQRLLGVIYLGSSLALGLVLAWIVQVWL